MRIDEQQTQRISINAYHHLYETTKELYKRLKQMSDKTGKWLLFAYLEGKRGNMDTRVLARQ